MKKAKKLFVGLILFVIMMTVSACGPSKDKIILAQSTYRNLINTHNAVVAAHSQIKDNSLDAELTALSDSIPEFESYNLYEMTDSQIESLVATMNTLIDSYSGYLNTIGEIKTAEEAAMLIPIGITLVNETDLTFTGLSLYEKGASGDTANALDSLSGFAPGREMIGLTIYKNSKNTPWIITFDESSKEEAEEGSAEEAADGYEIELDVAKYNSDNITLIIKEDEETGELFIE